MSSGIFHARQMAYVGAKPWHGLGTEVTDDNVATNAEAFLKAAHCDWEVGTTDFVVDEIVNDDILSIVGKKIANRKITFAEIEGKRQYFGVVSNRYQPLQNKVAFGWFQPWLDAGLAKLETGGYLFNGEKVWALARINVPQLEVVANDFVERYMLLSNSHDGTNAVRVGFVDIRVVCKNTLAMAHASKASKMIRIKHSKSVEANLEQIRDVVDMANQEFVATVDQYRYLASKTFNQNDVNRFVKIVLDQDKPDDKLSTRGKNLIEQVKKLITQGKGNMLDGVRGTWWAAYNAFTQYLTWSGGRNEANRLDNNWFGTGATDNKNALILATDFANGKQPPPQKQIIDIQID